MLRYVHAFRGLAIVLVVVSHAKLLVTWPAPATAYTSTLRALLEGGDIPFWFIAGFLFQHLAARFRYASYLRARTRSVVVPYLVCSVPILLHALVFGYGVFADVPADSALQLTWRLTHSLLTANHMFVPYWFIPTIVVLYLMAPLLIALDRRPRLYWLLPPALIAGAMMHLSPLYLDVMRDALHVLPVYLLGMAVSHHRELALDLLSRNRHLLFATAVGLTALAVALNLPERISSARMFSTENGVLDIIYLQKVVLTLWALERLSAWDASADRTQTPAYRAMATTADLSLGLFFVHMLVIRYLLEPVMQRASLTPTAGLLSLTGLTLVFLGASFVVVLIVKRAAGSYSRYLIGC